MILYFYGADTFRSRHYLRQSIDQFRKQRDPAGYNIAMHDGKKIELSKLMAELRVVPFLAEKRMVVVENLLSSSDKDLLYAVQEIIASKKVPESTIIILWQGEALSKVKEAKDLAALLSKEKFAQEFTPLTDAKLAAWISKEVTARAGTIEPPAVAFLVTNAGDDMWRLHSILDQLIAYSKGSPITLAHVQIFLNEKIDDNVFAMIEAMVAGNKKKAFTLLNEQRRLGEDEGKIFGLLIWQFRILLEIADVLTDDPRATSDTLAKKIGIHPFVVKKNFAVARNYSVAKLQHAYRALLDIDVKTKTGRADQGLLIDMFIEAL